MYITKILKRKDAASLLVAIPIALFVTELLPNMVARLAAKLSSAGNSGYATPYSYPGANWRGMYVQPIVAFLLEIILLELVTRVVVWIHPMVVKKAK